MTLHPSRHQHYRFPLSRLHDLGRITPHPSRRLHYQGFLCRLDLDLLALHSHLGVVDRHLLNVIE
jgi:hypothetical protein